MLITQSPKGTADILPQDSYRWQAMERVMHDVCRAYGFREVRVPTFEHTELFLRGVGDTTDIVQKEMYTFQDKGDRSITLKPEGTAGVARAFIQNKLFNLPLPAKMYYVSSSNFRYERPQAGRLREFHQFGVEAFGASDASVDAEVIALALDVIVKLGLEGLEVHLNSIGCPKCRPAYQARLKEYLRPHLDRLCDTCKGRFERNPLRILDCKSPECKEVILKAPRMVDCLCEDCKAHFTALTGYLDDMGVTYSIDPFIVRGLDYYTRTVFEIIASQIGAQSTVCGGGRYDGLIEELGGPATPAIGFAMGMERLLMAIDKYARPIPEPSLLEVYVAPLGEAAQSKAFTLTQALRAAGLAADCDHMRRSMKAQFKYADKTGCRYVAVLGEEELAKDVVKLRDMRRSQDETIAMGELAGILAARLQGEV